MITKENVNIYPSKIEKKLEGLYFSVQQLRFLKTFKTLSCFPQKGMPIISKSLCHTAALSLHISMFIMLTSWSFSFEEGNGASQLY